MSEPSSHDSTSGGGAHISDPLVNPCLDAGHPVDREAPTRFLGCEGGSPRAGSPCPLPVYLSQSGPGHPGSEELAAAHPSASPGGEPVPASPSMAFSYSDSERTWDSGTSSKSESWSAGQSLVLGASRCASVLLEKARAIWSSLDSAPMGQLTAEPCLTWDPAEVAHMLNTQKLEAPTGLYLYGQRPGERCYLLYRRDKAATARRIQQELGGGVASQTILPEAVRECLQAWKKGSARDRGGDARARDLSSCGACGSALFSSRWWRLLSILWA